MTIKWINSLPLLIWVLFSACQQSTNTHVLKNVHCIDVVTGNVTLNQDVYIVGNRINSIQPSQAEIDLPSEKLIDCSGQYLIPGLWDMHVHALGDFEYQYALPLYVANGITGIRDMWGNLTLADSLRKLEALHNLPLPRLYLGGGILGGNPARAGTSIATIEEGIQYVDTLVKYGADFIKTYEYLKPEIYFAIVERAKKHGLPVFGHPPKLVGMRKAIHAGQKSFEHLSMIPFWCTPFTDFLIKDMENEWYGPRIPLTTEAFLDTIYHGFSEDSLLSLAKSMVEADAYFCPTLMVYQNIANPFAAEKNSQDILGYYNPFRAWFWSRDVEWDKENFLRDSVNYVWHRRLERRKFILEKLIDSGVRIVAGTDAPVSIHGYDLHRELEMYCTLGMTPLEALQSATIHPAKLLGKDDQMGQIKEGFVADLVLLEQNPLEDIRNTTSISSVIVDGNYVSNPDILASLQQIELLHWSHCLDTISTVLEKRGLETAINLIDSLWQKPGYYLGGGQLTALAYQQEDIKMEEKLLQKEVELHPKEATYAWMSLVDLYAESNRKDSALIYANRAIANHNSSFTHMYSRIKRLEDPGYGLPKYQSLTVRELSKYEGSYFGPDKCALKIIESDLFLIFDSDSICLKPINKNVFSLRGREPERLIFRPGEKNSFKLIKGRNSQNYVSS